MAKEQAGRIGRRIRERRNELGMSQQQLADAIPSATVNSDYISKWERGENKPSDENLERLAAALDTTIVDLLAGPIAERTPKGETPDLNAALNGNQSDELVLLRDEIAALNDKVERLLTAFGLADDRADLDAMGDRVLAAFAHALEQVAEAGEAERAAG